MAGRDCLIEMIFAVTFVHGQLQHLLARPHKKVASIVFDIDSRLNCGGGPNNLPSVGAGGQYCHG